ncbi:MAG: hypothetical protein L0332_25160 [Chloroflexi bacterium]|nr:hypothetical protein [Chloroflexota bacterium]MCI0575180.1 hypothetical protein [Chloroflexota bacterium]MCI0647138.1 hypothetical protein [Chloroflexota bacterium]MCI0729986.1 hypothetical protein [Chloroflexota bacterium]
MNTGIKSATRRIIIHSDLDIIVARLKAREVAREMGFSTIDQARISLAAGELARALAKVMDSSGEIVISGINANGQCGVQVISVTPQAGPDGLENAGGVTDDHYPEMADVAALVDECRVENQGTRVTLMKWLV